MAVVDRRGVVRTHVIITYRRVTVTAFPPTVSSGPLGVPVHYHYYMAVAVEYWCTLVAV